MMFKNLHYVHDFEYFECGKIWHVLYKLVGKIYYIM